MRNGKNGKRRSVIAGAAMLVAVAAVSGTADAAFFTWDGGSATTSNWTDAINWSTNVVPPNDGTADIIFSGAVRLTPSVDVAQSINSLQFFSGSGAFVVSGNTLTIGGAGGMDNKDDNAQTIQAPIVLAQPQTWFCGDGFATGNITLQGAVNNNGNLLTINPFLTSVFTISGAISGSGGLAKVATGTSRLDGSVGNTYSGTTTVNGGTMILAKTAGVAIPGPLTIGDSIGGTNADVVREDAINSIAFAQPVTINSSGLLDLNNFQPLSNLTIAGGNILLEPGSQLRISGNVNTVASATTATISGTGIVDLSAVSRTFNVSDGAAVDDLNISAPLATVGLIKAGAGTLVLGGSTPNTHASTEVTGGTLVLRKNLGVNAIVGSLSIGNNPGAPNTEVVRLDNSGQIADTTNVQINNTGLFNLNGFSETIATLSMTGGNVALSGGSLTVTNAIATSNATVAATISGAGSLNLGGVTCIFDIVQPPAPIPVGMDISSIITNGGITKNNQGTLQFSGSGSNTYTGDTFVRAGTLILAKTGVAVPGNLGIGDNLTLATVRATANGQLSNTAVYLSLNESGLLDLNGFNASVHNLNFFGGNITTGAGTLEVLGTFFAFVGAHGTNNSTFSGNVSFNNASKVIDIVGGMTVDLQANVVSGSIVKQGLGTLRLGGNNSAMGGVALEAGFLRVGNNQAIGFGALLVDGGTLSSDGVSRTDLVPAIFAGSGIVDEPASLTLRSLGGAGSLTKNGVGTLAFNIPSSFAGALTLNAGTLDAQLAAGNSFIQNGGTFSGGLLNQGTFTYNGGNFSGLLTNEGSIIFNADFTAGSGLENRSSLTISTGRTLTVNGAGLRNMGSFTLSGGSVAGSGGVLNDFSGQMSARGSIGSTLTNLGNLQTTGLLIASAGGSNFGVITILTTQSVSLGGDFINSGAINVVFGSVSGSGTLLNTAGGQIQGNGGISAPLNNAGGLIFANSSSPLVISSLAGGNTSGGELRIAGGSTLNVINPFSSSGTIVLQGINANMAGGVITNTGTISGKGRVSNTVNNSGVIRAEDGLLTMAGAACANNAVGSIQASAGATVFFSQGLATNAGTIALSGGTFDTNATAINNTGVIDGRGIFRSGGLTNSNKIAIADGPSEVYGNVINNASITITNTTATFFNNVTNNASGVIKTTSAVSRFLATFTNNGTFISDPSDNYFDSLAIGEGGALVGGDGDRFFVGGDLLSTSRARSRWNTVAAELHLLAGGSGDLLQVNGQDLGISFDGYDNNFAWGTLSLAAGRNLTLLDADAVPGGAVYVDQLDLQGGLAQIATISGNGLNLYYDLGNPENAYLSGRTYSLAGGGSIAPVPEPASTFIAMIASALLLAKRRRRNQHPFGDV